MHTQSIYLSTIAQSHRNRWKLCHRSATFISYVACCPHYYFAWFGDLAARLLFVIVQQVLKHTHFGTGCSEAESYDIRTSLTLQENEYLLGIVKLICWSVIYFSVFQMKNGFHLTAWQENNCKKMRWYFMTLCDNTLLLWEGIQWKVNATLLFADFNRQSHSISSHSSSFNQLFKSFIAISIHQRHCVQCSS